jgi:hypothetical protein
VPCNHDFKLPLTGFRAYGDCSNLSHTFHILLTVSRSEKVSHLHSVLQDMCDYTLIVVDYCDGRLKPQSLSVLADRRNHVQHSLMSLPADSGSGEPFQAEDPLYELSRLAAIIYSLLVIFPLPPRTAPFAELALRVKAQFSASNMAESWGRAPELLLWIVFMGAVASVNLPERSWYVSVLDRLTRRKRITTWNDLYDVLQGFLWLGSTSNSDGQALWKEIESASPFDP